MDAPAQRSAAPGAVRALPWGVRPLAGLTDEYAKLGGEELGHLGSLVSCGVPCADGLVVALAGDEAQERLLRAVDAAFASGAELVRLRALFPSRMLAARFERRAGLSLTIRNAAASTEPNETRADAVASFVRAVSDAEVTGAVGGSRARLFALVTACGEGPAGQAASADPVTGDPDQIRVWEAAVTPWLVDRRTTRVTVRGEGMLDDHGASSVADLADRAQLALGLPVEIAWVTSRGAKVVESVRPISPSPRFADAPYRIVTMITDDEGCVAPLAIDALDGALRVEGDLPTDARVRRIYARAYRRMADSSSRRPSAPVSIARAAARAARVAADVAAPLAAARAFDRSLAARLDAFDRVDLASLDDHALVEEIRARMGLAVDALALLDRGRLASIAVLAALEATVGSLPREVLPALANVRPVRARRRCYERMVRVARRIEQEHGELVAPDALSPALRKKWNELRSSLSAIRSLGLDVRPVPWGHDDGSLLAAIRAAPWEEDDSRERARKNAIRRVMATARQKPFGRAREALARSLAVLVVRVARIKGQTAEALAASMLRLRGAACDAGRRLADTGLVDEPEDALYLSFDEIEQGLAGEPGAYAARVRLRREDDARWAKWTAPRRIEPRRA